MTDTADEKCVVMEVTLEEYIITSIRDKYRFLYDFRDKRYRDKLLREKTWSSLARELNVDPKVIQTRWRSLRDRYIKEKKKPRSGSDATEKATWSLASMLSFLDGSINPRPTLSSLPGTSPISTASTPVSSVQLHTLSETVSLPSCSPSFPSPSSLSETLNSQPPSSLSNISSPPPSSSSHPCASETPNPLSNVSCPSNSSSCHILNSYTQTPSASRPTQKRKKRDELLEAILSRPPKEMNYEDYYCLSLAGRMKALSSKKQAKMRMMFEKFLYDIENEDD